MVAIISKTGKRLMPTSEYKARKLLKSKKAVICNYKPFVIQLLKNVAECTQPIEFSMDTGYAEIGLSVKSEKHEYLSMQIDTLKGEKQRHDDCRCYRRGRRNRKRYRKPRFDNRKREEKWLAPSIQHKLEVHLHWIEKISQYVPISFYSIEMGQFDTQLLKAIEKGEKPPEGTDYQHGERYGIAPLREAVFTRDNYTCQCCGKSIKDKVILHVHHIKYRSQGGSDSMDNLAAVCHQCHTPKNHKPGGKLYGWKPKLPSFKGATFMTTVRWILYNKVKEMFPEQDIFIKYGAETKEIRRERSIEKSHTNDAYCIGKFHPKHRCHPVHLKKKRRNNRILQKFYDAKYIDSRDGSIKSGQELASVRINRNHKLDGENLHPYRQQKKKKGKTTVRKKRYAIQPYDIVLYNNHFLQVKGCHCNGSRVMLDNGKSAAIKKVKTIQYAGGYVPA